MDDAESVVLTDLAEPATQCEELIQTKEVDKTTAIRIYKMYTTMLNDLQRLEASKTLEIESLKHELAIMRLSEKDREVLSSSQARIDSLTTRVQKLEETMKTHAQMFDRFKEEVNTHISGFENRLLALPGKRR